MREHQRAREGRLTWGALRTAAGFGLLVALAAFALPRAGAAGSTTQARLGLTERVQAAGPSPLQGHFQTYANGDRVTTMLRDGDTLWVGTIAGGLVRWSMSARTYVQYLAPQRALPGNDVNDIAPTGDGDLWLATSGGLGRFNPDTEVFTAITSDNSPGMPPGEVTALEPLSDGSLWVGFAERWDWDAEHPSDEGTGAFAGGGLARYRPASGEWSDEMHVTFDDSPGADVGEFATLTSENITELTLSSDGILWIGARPYYTWEPEQCAPGTCTGEGGEWMLSGGGLSGYKEETGEWQQWYQRPDGSGSCYSSQISDIVEDSEGRVWVGTSGRGTMVMRNGLQRTSCPGQARYQRPAIGDGGLLGNVVWSVGIDARGRIWMGHGDSKSDGRGIAILEHNDTIDDWSTPWDTDDEWEYVDFDGVPGKSTALITALLVDGQGPAVIGTQDEAHGDGYGVRLHYPDTGSWIPLRTADSGLPSNLISHIEHDAARGRTWFTLQERGVAVLDEASGAWQWWQAYENVADVAMVLAQTKATSNRVPVSIADAAEYEAAFPEAPRFARFGNDPTLYEITGYRPPRSGDDPALYVSPRVRNDIAPGASVFRTTRGPAGNHATQLAVASDGTAWSGGSFYLWQEGMTPGSTCDTYPQCYLDGGLGVFDGANWTVYNDSNSDLPANGVGAVQVNAIEIDPVGKVWAGTGDGRAAGDGIGVLNVATGEWTIHTARRGLRAGDGVADFDVDPVTGYMWSAHHPVLGYVTLPNGQQQRYFDGGGVARFDGAGWRSWTKPDAALQAFGDKGIMEAIAVDRVRNLVWAGGWDGDSVTYHWPKGRDVDAVVNWCPIDDCDDDDWQHKAWPDDGKVSSIALDADGRVWIGTNRELAGTVPPVGGVKLFDGAEWYTLTPENSGLQHIEIQVVEPAGDRMWVGTLNRGASVYLPGPAPTATPTATSVPTDTLTPSPTDTTEPTPTSQETATGTTTATEAPTVASATPTATMEPTSSTGCPPDGICRISLPFVLQDR
ncbi:MAG: two-component regulator propeller domain-containing protein [Anaerolineae bacterium]